jgi:hypothetical protein
LKPEALRSPNDSNYHLIIIGGVEGAEMMLLSEIAALFVLISDIIAGTICGS